MDGSVKIVKDQSTTVSLTNENIFLKSSYVYHSFVNSDDHDVYTQSIYKYYIQQSNDDTISTWLKISLFSGEDGSKITQTYLISNTY
jgi:hypothetical protein